MNRQHRMMIWMAVAALTAYGQTVDQRRENQQQRIAGGISSGQLTPGETAKVERQEKGVKRQVRQDRAGNGGKLTPAERRQVNREQNKLSGTIYNDKHNANRTNFKGEVGARQRNQQQRIARGVAKGSLTAGETAKLEGKEAGLNREVKGERRQNGGTLTPKERTQANHQENKLSGQIYKDKHNAATRP